MDEAVFTFDIKPFLDSIKAMEDGLKGMASKVKAMGESISKSIETPIKSGIEKMSHAINQMGASITGGLSGTVTSIIGDMGKLGNTIKQGLQAVDIRSFIERLKSIGNSIKDVPAQFKEMGSAIADTCNNAARQIGETLRNRFYDTVAVVTNSMERIRQSISAKLQSINIKPFLDSIKAAGERIKEIAPKVKELGETVKTVVSNAREQFKGIISSLKTIGGSIRSVTLKSKEFVEKTINSVVQQFKYVSNIIKTSVKGIFNAVTAPIKLIQKGIQKLAGMIPPPIKKGISDAVNGSANIAKNLGQSITNGIKAGVKSGIMEIGKIFVVFNAAKNLFSQQMPEVGEAFNIASDIVLKNFFLPIRQLVLPLLNSMLKWVTEHQATFVRWGAAVANVFRTVILVAKQLWDIFKQVIDAVGNSLQKALGTNFKSFDEFLNMLSFKISAIIIWMGMVCKGLDTNFTQAFDWIIAQGEKVVAWVVNFAAELAKAATDTGTFRAAFEFLKSVIEGGIDVAGDALDAIKQIGLNLLMPNQSGDNVATILQSMMRTVEALGPAIRNAIAEFTKGFNASTSEIATPVRTIVDSITGIVKAFDTEEARKVFNSLGNMIGTAFMGGAEIVQGVASAFASLVENLFKKQDGASLGTIMDKIASAFTSLKNVVVTITSDFFKGFTDALGTIGIPINNVLGSLKELFELLDDNRGGLGKAFQTLGAILGGTFLYIIAAVATQMDAIATSMRTIITLVGGTGTDQGRLAAISQMWSEFGTRTLSNARAVGTAFSIVPTIWANQTDPEVRQQLEAANQALGVQNVHDAIITKTGQVIQTDPDDTIIAAKQIISGGSEGKVRGNKPNITVTFGPTYITVTEGNAEKAGSNFGQAQARSFGEAIADEMLLEGY